MTGQAALFLSVYGTRLNRDDLHRLLKAAADRAGLTNVHPHRLRHTAAIMFLRNGGDALNLQRMLGHSDVPMTRRYVALVGSDLVAKHRACSPGDRFLSAAAKAGGRKRLRQRRGREAGQRGRAAGVAALPACLAMANARALSPTGRQEAGRAAAKRGSGWWLPTAQRREDADGSGGMQGVRDGGEHGGYLVPGVRVSCSGQGREYRGGASSRGSGGR